MSLLSPPPRSVCIIWPDALMLSFVHHACCLYNPVFCNSYHIPSAAFYYLTMSSALAAVWRKKRRAQRCCLAPVPARRAPLRCSWGWGQTRGTNALQQVCRWPSCAQELALTGMSSEQKKGALVVPGDALWDDTSKGGRDGL